MAKHAVSLPEHRNFYRGWGLDISSDLDLPEFSRSAISATADVVVELGVVSEGLVSRAEPGEWSCHTGSRSHIVIEIHAIGRFEISNGNHIVVERFSGVTDHGIRTFLLGSVFAALLHQRESLVLHAAGFVCANGAVLLAGDSGAGKSTVLGEFLNRGYPMIVDDVAAVGTHADGSLLVQPGIPRTRLWADAADALGVPIVGLAQVRPDMAKFERILTESFHQEPASFHRLFVLSVDEACDAAVRSYPVTGIEAFQRVVATEYRGMAAQGMKMSKRQLAVASEIAKTVPLVVIERSATPTVPSIIADIIEEELGV